MKFSMEQAWDGALKQIMANRDLVLVLGGLFFFVPSVLLTIFLPEPPATADPSPEQALEMMSTYLSGAWLYILMSSVIGMIGTMATLALLSDRERPTMGEALSHALAGMIPYIASALITALGMALIAAVLVGIPASVAANFLIPVAVLIVAILALYVTIKTSLTPAVIIKEDQRNPIAALKRSWQLTKGNSLRLLGFYALLFIPYIILAMLTGGILSAVGSMLGGAEIARFVGGIGEGVIVGAWGVLSATIMAAIHRQLAGEQDGPTQVFE